MSGGARLIDALRGETVAREYSYGKGKVELRTLEQGEIDEVAGKVARTDFSLIELQKIPLLSRSLISVNGVSVNAFQEVQDAIKKDPKADVVRVREEILGKLDQGVVNILYDIYLMHVEAVDKERQELKNSSRVQSAEPSTKSAKS